MEYKHCTKCNKLLPKTTEYFYRQKSKYKDKVYHFLQSHCKDCVRDAQYNRYIKNRDKMNEVTYQRYLNNKDEYNERAKEWQEENKERHQENQKKWQQENKDKIREYQIYREFHKGHKISTKEWNFCKDYFGYQCVYCGMTEEESLEVNKQRLHKDHAINYGENDISNCVSACRTCNIKKGSRDYNKWYNGELEFYENERFNLIEKWLNEDWEQAKSL
jgi:hypothetical protein